MRLIRKKLKRVREKIFGKFGVASKEHFLCKLKDVWKRHVFLKYYNVKRTIL